MTNYVHSVLRWCIRCFVVVLCCMPLQLVAQYPDWSDGGYVRWSNIIASGSKEWDSTRDTLSVVLRIFDKVAPIDTVSFLVYYPASVTEVQGRPAITIRIDGYRGRGTQIAKNSKAFYRTTSNRLASNISGDVVSLTTSVFDTLNHSIAGSFDMQCTYEAADQSDNQKFHLKGVFVIRGVVVEPADVGLHPGEAMTFRMLTAPGAAVRVDEGNSSQQVTANAQGVATYVRTLSASQSVSPVKLLFRKDTASNAGVVRTIYVDTSFSRPVSLPFPDKRGFQILTCRTAPDKRNNTRRAEFSRPDKFRAVNFKDSADVSSVELYRLPVDSVFTTDTSAALACISVRAKVAVELHTDSLLSRASAASADTALVQWLGANEYRAVGSVQSDSLALRIRGGVFDGKTVRIPCRRQRFEREETRDSVAGTLVSARYTVRGEIVAANWGVAPAGVFANSRARGLVLISSTTFIDQRTSDSSHIAIQNPLMLGRVHAGAATAAAVCDSLNAVFLRKVKDSLIGAVPEYLLLYDFTASATVSPDSIDNINQYDRGATDGLPVRHSYAGGNACGASSLTMALSALLPPSQRYTLSEVYNNTLQIGLRKSDATTASVVPAETEQAFLWERAARWLWGDTLSAGMCLTNTNASVYSCRMYTPDLRTAGLDATLLPAYGMRRWVDVDAWLGRKRPVLIGTYLGTGTNPSGGHVILLLGVGANSEVRSMLRSMNVDTNYYIVADPAGHFYANPAAGGMNRGHYGLAGALDSLCVGISHSGWFAMYPRDQFRLRAGNADSTRYTLSFFNDSTVYVRFRSRCSRAACATNGVDAKGDNVLLAGEQVDVPATVSVTVVDAEGNRTGMNADGSVVQHIVGSSVDVAFGEEESGDNSNGSDVQLRDALVIALQKPQPGAYKLEITGADNTEYDVDIVMVNVAGHKYERKSKRDTVESGQTLSYDILIPTDVPEEVNAPYQLLRRTYPEPAGYLAHVEFALERSQHVRLSVVNMMGAEIAVLVDHYVESGVHLASWSTERVPAGVYFCRIEVDGVVEVRRITVLR